MQEDGASAALKALILKIESVCVSVLKTQGSFRFYNFSCRTAPSEGSRGTARSCTKPQIAQEVILANHAHTLSSALASKWFTHICTLLYTAGHTLHVVTPNREGIPGCPDATTTVFPPFSKSGPTISSLVSGFPLTGACNVVHYFFNFTFRGITKSKGQVLHEYIRTYSEYICISHSFIMHKYIHAYSRLCCMHREGWWGI